MKKTNIKHHTIKILGISLLAAAWIIAGPEWLAKLGLQSTKLIKLLSYVPAIMVIIFITKDRPGFLSCERRTFKRILGIK